MPIDKTKRPAIPAIFLLSSWLVASLVFSKNVDFEVVSSVPLGTAISRAGTRDAASVWLEMIRGARVSLDLAEFYLSGEKGEALEPVIEAILAAAGRGVKVRFLCEKSMAGTYPETLRRFDHRPNVLVRLFDWKPLTGGVLHAKYFIVDDREVFIGSQNFDWRSLSHIHETGLRIGSAPFVRAMQSIFMADWRYSGGDEAAYQELAALTPCRFAAGAYLVASPERFNPPGVGAALDELLSLIDNARQRITVQLLSYSLEIAGRQEKFTAIDLALRRAARRGVSVRILVSNWNLRRPQVESLQSLAREANIEIKFAVIPQAKQGFIPFARVIHSKVMRVDTDVSWLGTSNWGYDYFFKSRNVEAVLRLPEVARVLDELFASLWNGPYATRLEPGKKYIPPRIN
jgi:phosphatidylserine/phosphatidylglycerophosphate/cardiolipin synthase-like enzyme